MLVCRLGLQEYERAWALQRKIAEARRRDRLPDVLLLLEHPPTYTVGRLGQPEHILLSDQELARRRLAVHYVDRGGDVTFHGPEQLVIYPIFKLARNRADCLRYLRCAEAAILECVREFGVSAVLHQGYSGIWVEGAKLCAIGVKVDSGGVTTHGMAMNVNTDLSYFSHIIPCGIADRGVTSLQEVLGRRISMQRVMRTVTASLARQFEKDVRSLSAARLYRMLERVGS